MPPKLPNMKFKPKPQTKVETGQEDLADEMSLLSAFQMRRLQGENPQSPLGGDSAAAPTTTSGPTSDNNENREQARSRVKVEKSAPKTKSSTARGGVALSSLAEQATIPNVKIESLPQNSMSRLLDDEAVAGASGIGGQKHILPIPLAKKVDGDEKHVATSAATSAMSGEDAGVAFLKQASVEDRAVRKANKELLCPSTPKKSDEVAWMQLPKAVGAAMTQFSLSNSSPGRIGELVVYKSGKTVLKIGEAKYKVACERQDASNNISQCLAAVLPPSTAGEDPGCYQLDQVATKLVCTPLTEE